MALYYYKCEKCKMQMSRILPADKSKAPQECIWCGGTAIRAPRAPSTAVMEKIDNGLMARAVVRPADAEKMFKDRSLVDYEEKEAVRQDFKNIDK